MALNHTFKHQICGCTKMVFHHLFTIAAASQSAAGGVKGTGEALSCTKHSPTSWRRAHVLTPLYNVHKQYTLYTQICTNQRTWCWKHNVLHQLCQPAYMKVLKRRCFAPNCTKQCTYVWLHTLSFQWNVLAPRAPLQLLLPVKVKYTPFLLHILFDLIASIWL